MTIKQAIEVVLDAGLSIVEHANNSGAKTVNHLSIIGGKRRVEFYPTTGTVHSNPTESFSRVVKRNCTVFDAIKVAKTGAL